MRLLPATAGLGDAVLVMLTSARLWTVAVAVAEAAAAEGLAEVELGDVVQQVQDAMWQPEYSRIKAS